MPHSLSPISLNSPPSRLPATFSPSPSPSSPASGSIAAGGSSAARRRASTSLSKRPLALLVPTDRPREELEAKWLPRLGRLRVEREVELQGYALYGLRTWYLSRTHWSNTIVTQTGKQTERISVYVLVPLPELSEKAAAQEIDMATQYLATEQHSTKRKTEFGTLLVTTPSAFGQDIIPIPGGDLRAAIPYLIVNNGLRRLGCGGRATMGMEPPLPALRRKFYELYRLPQPSNPAPLSRSTSPTTSPSNKQLTTSPTAMSPAAQSPHSPANHPLLSDPFAYMLIELVKLIQASLALWGFFGPERPDEEPIEVDGLFCDETKKGVFAWRRAMGMEHEESMRMERETSGGCIDPKTLAALLSSITSVRYQLDVLDVEKVSKDPFSHVRRFLSTWQGYHGGRGHFLTVASVRELHARYLAERTRNHLDSLKVHRMLLSGVASATSSLSANLKGGSTEAAPLRKREHHLRFRGAGGETEGESDTGGAMDGDGVGMIIPEGEVGPVAPPDVITSDLEAYTRGILKSREKDWDTMGARRIGELWSGAIGDGERKYGRLERAVLRRMTGNRQGTANLEDGEDGAGRGKAAIEGIKRTGQVLKGVVSRRGTANDTSDSEGGAASSVRNHLVRRKQGTIPTLIEPDVEEVEEHLDYQPSLSPSPTTSMAQLDRPFNSISTRPSFVGAASVNSKRPSIVTNMSDAAGYRPVSPMEDQWSASPSERAVQWRNRGRATAMLRTSSDGADVVLEEGGMEWEVVEPHGTGRGRSEKQVAGSLSRRHSLQDRLCYRDMRVAQPENLAVDVEMCSVVLELRERERQLAQKAKDMATLEHSIFVATQSIIDPIRARRSRLTELRAEAADLEKVVSQASDEVDRDEELGKANRHIKWYLSEHANEGEISHYIGVLEADWDKVRKRKEEMRREVEGVDEDGNGVKGSWWRLGL